MEFDPNTRAKPKPKSPHAAKTPVHSVEDVAAVALPTMRLHLESAEVEAACRLQKSSRSLYGWQPRESDWIDLVEALLERERWDEAVAVLRDYHRPEPEPSPRMGLKLAQILIQKLHRPLQGIEVLARIPPATMPEKLEAFRRQLVDQANQMTHDEDGPIELQDELW